MGWIVDHIVNTDAPAATLAQQASIEMLEARRAERNYLLLHDAIYLQANRTALDKTQQILESIQILKTGDQGALQKASEGLSLYRQQFASAVSVLDGPGQRPADRVRTVVRDYERDLNDLLKNSRRIKRAQLMEELRKRVGSFDAQISKTVQEGSPELQRITEELQSSSQQILEQASFLESVNWGRVQRDHAQAGHLIRRAEWTLGIVSAVTLLVSVWVSYILPRQVIKPLLSLREAVDHVAQGNCEIEFDVQGKGEIVDLVDSLRRMLVAVRQKS